MTNSLVPVGNKAISTVSGFIASFKEKTKVLSRKMLAAPCPGEPQGITQDERDSLWNAWTILNPGIIARSLQVENRPLKFVAGFCVFTWLMMIATGHSVGTLPLLLFVGVTWAFKSEKLNLIVHLKERSQCVQRIRNASWSLQLLDSFMNARSHGVRFSPELEAIEAIVRSAYDEDLARVPADDIVGMLRLSRDLDALLYRNLGRLTAEPCGERSELIGRVAASLPGPPLSSIVSSIKAGSSVIVKI